jgi:hypothetical protein
MLSDFKYDVQEETTPIHQGQTLNPDLYDSQRMMLEGMEKQLSFKRHVVRRPDKTQ